MSSSVSLAIRQMQKRFAEIEKELYKLTARVRIGRVHTAFFATDDLALFVKKGWYFPPRYVRRGSTGERYWMVGGLGFAVAIRTIWAGSTPGARPAPVPAPATV